MFKMMAVMCILVWPDGSMQSKLECTTYYESDKRTFLTVESCETAALKKLEMTLAGMDSYGADYKSITVGCEGGDES